MIHLSFPGFTGSLEALREALRRGRLSPREVPVLLVVDQALAQVPEDLRARSELLPPLAELLLLKLAPERALTPKEEGEEAPWSGPSWTSPRPWPSSRPAFSAGPASSPCPRPPAPARPPPPPKALLQAARSFRRAVLHLPREGFGLREAWERLKALLKGRAVFQNLPLATWAERAVAFAALLEAHRLGRVRLSQEAPFAPFTWRPWANSKTLTRARVWPRMTLASAGVAELVDAHDSGSCVREDVRVQVPPPAPKGPAKAGPLPLASWAPRPQTGRNARPGREGRA